MECNVELGFSSSPRNTSVAGRRACSKARACKSCLTLLGKRVAVFFRPVAIGRHCLHRRPALGSTSTRAFHLGFGHTEAGLRPQAGTHVDDLCLFFRVTTRRKARQQEQGKNDSCKSRAVSHRLFPNTSGVEKARMLLKTASRNIHLTWILYSHYGS